MFNVLQIPSLYICENKNAAHRLRLVLFMADAYGPYRTVDESEIQNKQFLFA